MVGPVICGPKWALGLIPTLLPPQRSVDELDGSFVSLVPGPKDEEGYFAFMNDLTYGRPDRLEGIVPGQMCQCMPALFRAGVRSWFYDRSSSVLFRGSSSHARVTLHEEFPVAELRRADSERAERTDPRRAENSDHTRHFDIVCRDLILRIFQQLCRISEEICSRRLVKMTSSHDAQGFRGNQGEDEDVDAISVEPITMIVPSKLQDSPRTATLENSSSSSTSSGSENHQPSTSSDSPVEGTSGEVRGAEEVGCSMPLASTAVEVVLFERAVLHHEVADGAATVKGYKKLEQMVRRFQIPRTILIRAGTPNERACSVSRTGWVPVYVDHFEADLRFPLPGLIFDVLAEYELALSQLTPNSIKFIIGFYAVVRKARDAYKGGGLQVALSVPFVPVHQWDEVFVFVRDTRTDRINNELAARLSEWRTLNTYMNYPQLTSGNVDLKNRLLDYVKARGLVDLEALVTQEQIALLGFFDVANLHSQGGRGAGSSSQRQSRFDERPPAAPGRSSQHRSSSSSHRPRNEQRRETAPSISRRRAREESDAEDDVPLIRRRTSAGSQPAPAVTARPASVPQASAREVAEAAPALSSVVGPKIAYPDGFSYARTECQAAMLQGMQSFVPPADRLRAKGLVQHYTVALFECEQGSRAENNELQQNCKQLASEKASLADEVNHLQSSEMANRAASAESRADELARKVDELKEKLQRAQVEKETGIQAAKEELSRAEERARKAESEKDSTLRELSALRERVSQADQHIARAEASLNSTKRLHQHDVCFARAQGAEWLVGAEMFQDAVAVASANTTTDIFNKVRGKVLQAQADFPIGEMAFYEGKEIDGDGKSLAPPADTRVRLKWELNEEGLLVWPPAIVEEGEDTEGLPSFDAWVAGPQDVSVEPSSTPPAQPQPLPAAAAVPAPSPSDRPSPARSASELNNASIPVDLTDDELRIFCISFLYFCVNQ
ncbi:hypothetical protein SLEP1_g17369 [Rubroshorea leprosula]|uniref:Transposase (putative) gypsy type domain-containing protein n=1 Tax=Rubroshorea leprosula TaxID=152421 RepID=A0AAV5IZK0_9ROSI|nr:hypothetical protein SLEP1_g17369 [Rubroshorea leprosula]